MSATLEFCRILPLTASERFLYINNTVNHLEGQVSCKTMCVDVWWCLRYVVCNYLGHFLPRKGKRLGSKLVLKLRFIEIPLPCPMRSIHVLIQLPRELSSKCVSYVLILCTYGFHFCIIYQFFFFIFVCFTRLLMCFLCTLCPYPMSFSLVSYLVPCLSIHMLIQLLREMSSKCVSHAFQPNTWKTIDSMTILALRLSTLVLLPQE